MKYLLDTHTWIWMHAAPEELSPACVRLFGGLKGRDELLLSSISLWELCKLVEKRRVTLREDLEAWVRVVPLDFLVFHRSTTLPPPFHADPADQMIVATARLNDATIVTRDALLRNYPHVRTLW